MRRALVMLLVCAVPLVARAGDGGAKAGIEAGNKKFADAVAKGDAAALAKLYAVDGAILPPGRPMLRGREAIREGVRGAGRRPSRRSASPRKEVYPMGNLALEVSSLEARGRLGEGPRGQGDGAVEEDRQDLGAVPGHLERDAPPPEPPKPAAAAPAPAAAPTGEVGDPPCSERLLIGVETAQRTIDGSPFGRWWGYRVEELGAGYARLLLPFQAHFERPGGVLQGGCAMTLADVDVLDRRDDGHGPTPRARTLQMSSTFLRPATAGRPPLRGPHPPRWASHPLRRGLGHGRRRQPPDAPRPDLHAAHPAAGA